MPELPEVETTRQGIAPHIENKHITNITINNGRLRWPVPADLPELLEGKPLLNVSRRAKYLLFEFEHGTVIAHLGMSGSMRIVSAGTVFKKHDHIDWQFDNGQCLRYHDPRRFGCMLWTPDAPEQHTLIKNLGPEPLHDTFDGKHLHQKSRTRSIAVKPFIMNSAVVVGVGNIYASEALYAAGIRPTRSAKCITLQQYCVLAEEIKRILEKSIAQGGTTLRDFVNSDGQPGYFAQKLSVYGRKGETCNACNSTIKHIVQAQRASYYCPTCQTG